MNIVLDACTTYNKNITDILTGNDSFEEESNRTNTVALSVDKNGFKYRSSK